MVLIVPVPLLIVVVGLFCGGNITAPNCTCPPFAGPVYVSPSLDVSDFYCRMALPPAGDFGEYNGDDCDSDCVVLVVVISIWRLS
jgi:hypothetical protein